MTESASYRTVAGRATGDHRDRGSEFTAHVDHVTTVEDAESMIADVRAAHADATHVVPAYRVRADPFREYASDDGEPRGSAGDPILTVLRGEELENIAVAVVRYYGGTNLGIGGLVRAYQAATKAAIEAAGIVERRPRASLRLETTYDDSGVVRGILEGSEASFSAAYEERVTFTVAVPVGERASLVDRLLDATSGRVTIVDG